MEMQRLRQLGNSKTEFETIPVPEPRPHEVVIRTAVSALCGSELKTYRGDGLKGNGGHEAAGLIVAVGSQVTRVAIGQRVGVSAVSGCGHCHHCARGAFTWCDNWRFHGNMHAEFFAIPEMCCNILPDDVSWEAGVLVSGDGLGVPYHASKRFDVAEGDAVAVIGLGPVGLGAVLMQKFLGRRVIGTDISKTRLDYARALGADEVIHGGEPGEALAAIRALTGGMGPAVCIEAGGAPSSVELCFHCVRKGGMVVFNGEIDAKLLSPSADFIRRDVAAVGTWYFHACEVPEMLALVKAGLDPARLISHQFDWQDADEAFAMMSAGKTAKVILRWPASYEGRSEENTAATSSGGPHRPSVPAQ